jgi:hypothetical protein
MLAELRNDAEQLAAHPDRRPQSETFIDIGLMRDGMATASLWEGR